MVSAVSLPCRRRPCKGSQGRDIKQLERHEHNILSIGYRPPSILSYVVAYDGPASRETVNSWLNPIHQDLRLYYPTMSSQNRLTTSSPSLDGIFMLGKGFMLFASAPFIFPAVEQGLKAKKLISVLTAESYCVI
jgi:hypothetical protein